MRTSEDYLDSLIQYLPNGRMWESKSIGGSNFRKLLSGISLEIERASNHIKSFERHIFPETGTLYLDDWERALAIPDKCLTSRDTDDKRLRNIIVKLTRLSAITANDFVEIAEIFGITAVVQPAIESISFPLVFPIPLFDTEIDARYTIHILIDREINYFFPYDFPVIFGDEQQAIVECLFNSIKPTNTQIIFIGI